ncbi:MAG: low specificity L-threonine aldolase [Polyangiales bacterium]
MDFRSDNVSGAHPAILEAVVRANQGVASPYGADAITERLTARFSELFEREVAVAVVSTGTAANALALSLYAPPWGAIYCDAHAHIAVDECGAPELFTAGAKLVGLHGQDGKLDARTLEAAIPKRGFVHEVQPAAVSISQIAESGLTYAPGEIAALSEVARKHGLALHVDGARFANAVASLGASPAALTWQAGVDVLSFGATKNGALGAEAVVLFDPRKLEELGYRRKRAGHLLSKMRYASAQLEAYLADDLWLKNARHANAMAARLAEGLTSRGHAPVLPVHANELFVPIPEAEATALRERGFSFYDWPPLGADARRLVTAWDTRAEDVEALLRTVG